MLHSPKKAGRNERTGDSANPPRRVLEVGVIVRRSSVRPAPLRRTRQSLGTVVAEYFGEKWEENHRFVAPS